MPLFHNRYQEIQELCPMHRQLLDFLRVNRGYGDDLCAIVELSEHNPDAAAFTCNV
jgi:hypothetical protein